MIRIAETPFDPFKEMEAFNARLLADGQGFGAAASFIGTVRDQIASPKDAPKAPGAAQENPVTALYLEHYPGATERSILAIADQAKARFELHGYLIIHRVGELAPGEPIVLAAAAAAHRRAAFEAVDFMMDYLKTEALFWKKERRATGDEWIEPRAADYKDAARWS